MTPLESLMAANGVGARRSVDRERNKLIVEWDEARPSEEIMAALKEHRDWLIAHLLQPPSPPKCHQCGRAQHEADYVCPEPTPADANFPIAPPYWPPPPLPKPCPDCGRIAWWARPDGGQVCGVCHPDPRVLLERRAQQEAPME
jgi:hypothetical protein